MARHLRYKPLDAVLMDRARGHVVSSLDPVGGGVHCSLGGGEFDYIVTSTLASQAPPAVGRALGGGLANFLLKGKGKFASDFVSYVSVGDGSVNNAHFLTAINMAEYASFRNYKCPLVFGISDNDICISLKGHGYLGKFFADKLKMPVYKCDGSNLLDVYRATKEAVAYARKEARPVALIFSNIPRRFGHAATDRQAAYLTPEEIARAQQRNPLAGACAQAVEAGIVTYPELAAELRGIIDKTRLSFDEAVKEPKITSRQAMLDRVSQPLVPVASAPSSVEEDKKSKSSAVMRKHMNTVIDETLTKDKSAVYVGEDVEHGGYYLVTEGLAKKFPMRVRDFPPDETSILGMGIGFSQAGLLPIVEMPYAKVCVSVCE
jgi:2-oxoisovalerate dehydrogenase E1 component